MWAHEAITRSVESGSAACIASASETGVYSSSAPTTTRAGTVTRVSRSR